MFNNVRLLAGLAVICALAGWTNSADAQITTFRTATAAPYGVSFLTNGNLVYSSTSSGIRRIDTGGVESQLSDIPYNAHGVVTYGGYIYGAAPFGGVVRRNDATCTTTACATENYAGSATQPEDVAFDTAGNLYVTNSATGEVLRSAAGCTVECTLDYFGATPQPAYGVTVASNGDLYVVSAPASGAATLERAPAGCTLPCTFTTFATLAQGSRGVIQGPTGDFFVSNLFGAVQRVTSEGAVSNYASSDGAAYRDLSIGPDGRAYLANSAQSRVDVVDLPSAAPPPVTVPTLSEWAMILFALGLAGGAALVVSRRFGVRS